MARLALDTIAPLVRVVFLVTIVAGAGDAAEQLRTLVAAQARGFAMLAEQWKAGFGVIEALRGFPCTRLMAVFAIIAQSARMHVLGFVAGHALGGSATEHVRLTMTARAFGQRMSTQQRKAGLAVIELRLFP